MNSQERGADNDGIDEICGLMVGVGGGGEVKNDENRRAAKNGGKPIMSLRKRDRPRALARMR